MSSTITPPLDYTTEVSGDRVSVMFSGRLDVYNVGRVWRDLFSHLPDWRPSRLVFDLARVSYCDGAGVGLLLHAEQVVEEWNGQVEYHGRSDEIVTLMQQYGTPEFERMQKEEPLFSNIPDVVGEETYNLLEKTQLLVMFLGETIYHFLRAMVRPSLVRWKDYFIICEQVGANALPIIGLIGFLLGLIMAFQSAVPMAQFGVEIYVASLVGLSLIRELGPLITAVILAGRTGSSFAAELGTMKVGEELDALATMGMDPARFLVIPRIMAGVTMIPFLTIFFNFLGLIGGSVVLLSMGYPMVAYVNQVVSAVSIADVLGGLGKAVVFGGLVAGIGCFHGMQTGSGASAVGESTTKAVVNGIIAIAVTDGLFAVLFFFLDI